MCVILDFLNLAPAIDSERNIDALFMCLRVTSMDLCESYST